MKLLKIFARGNIFLTVLSTETNSFFKNTFKKLLFLCWESSPKIFTGNWSLHLVLYLKRVI